MSWFFCVLIPSLEHLLICVLIIVKQTAILRRPHPQLPSKVFDVGITTGHRHVLQVIVKGTLHICLIKEQMPQPFLVSPKVEISASGC